MPIGYIHRIHIDEQAFSICTSIYNSFSDALANLSATGNDVV